MSGKLQTLIAILVIYPLGVAAQGIDEVIAALKSTDCYESTVDYQVLMSLQDDVAYRIGLHSMAAEGDTLAPCDYLIDWSIDTPAGTSTGFSAYFDGNAYNFRGDRLMEYHYTWDSIPFRPRGMSAAALPGVQRQAQFSNLLPQFIAEELTDIATNADYRYSCHPDTMINDRRCTVIDGEMVMNGVTYKEFLYAFDKTSMMPVYIELENNPGALAEQSITATYTNTSNHCQSIDESELKNRYPEIFEKYRESNYAIENLPGQRLPGFALPTTTRERYSRRLGDPFRCPTLLVLLDPASAFASATVKSIRTAVDSLPYNADVIWAFVSNNVDEIESIVPAIRPGEHLLTSAKSLARDCGAAAFPVTIITRADGTVADVVIGYNNDLATVVIQKAAIAAK